MTVTQPSGNSGKDSLSQKQIRAGEQVDQLFKLVALPDVGNTRDFLTAATAMFAKHDEMIGAIAVMEIATRSDRPTLRVIREVLDELSASERDRQEVRARHPRLLMLPRPPRTAEEQARIDESIADWKKRSSGMGLRKSSLPPSAGARLAALSPLGNVVGNIIGDAEKRMAGANSGVDQISKAG